MVTAENTIEAYQSKLLKMTDKHIEFPVTADLYSFATSGLLPYLDNDVLVDSLLQSHLFGVVGWDLCKFHSCYQTTLGIGSCGEGLIRKIEALKEDPRVVKILDSAFTLSGFSRSFLWRLSKHLVFSALPESDRGQYIEHLEERQCQFLFYIENPRFCR